MFTGIIKAKGRIRRIESCGGDRRLTIASSGLEWSGFEVGESIAVNGVCLTAVALHEDGFVTDVSVETLEVSALKYLREGGAVNLEPALSLGERLGGHLVSGHVDGVGRIEACDAVGRSARLRIGVADEYRKYIARKGSVCVDGVSLTVNAVSGNRFEVNIIPHTAAMTIIGGYETGDRVNIEVDLVARYLERLLSANEDAGITRDFLRAHGYG